VDSLPSDDELAVRLKSGDREALAQFIERRRPQLLVFVERRMSSRLRSKVDAADICQEVTVTALTSLTAVELGDRDPFGWLCQQAERRIVDAHRRHFGALKRSAYGEVGLHGPDAGDSDGQIADLLAATMTSPSSAYSRQQREFHMLEALQNLSDEAREALKLRYLHGLPSKEIAARIGKTDGATRVLLTRSLQKLQNILAQNSDFQSLVLRRPTSDPPV
jgi:RNA polymerase sigma-70 factor (ECF subfamily)